MDALLQYLRELNLCSMCLRIVLAMVLGGFLGFDREIQHRPAGFRTYMLVAMAAACTAILSQYLDLMLNTFWKDAYDIVGRRTDLVRLGARVVSGIGFLGTGTIMITERKEVTGLTTACCLWAAACMGLAIGAGFYGFRDASAAAAGAGASGQLHPHEHLCGDGQSARSACCVREHQGPRDLSL